MLMPTSMNLDHAFWARFAKSYWEKKPLVVKNLRNVPLDAEQIFALVLRFSDICRKKKSADGFKLYLDGQRLYPEGTLRYLPKKSDKSLQGYHERMSEEFADYCLVCDELLQVCSKDENSLFEFTHDFYRHVGFPNRFTEMGLYLGNYRKTPFGVHIDGCGVLSFPVIGKKKFRLWTSEYVKKHPQLERAFKYPKHKGDSQVLEAGPGDMTYWPSSAWHIAEADGEFSATWSLGVWVDRPHKDFVTEAMKEVMSAALGERTHEAMAAFETLYHNDGRIGPCPDVFQDFLRALGNLSATELQAAFMQTWLAHVSQRGLKPSPQSTASSKITMRSRLRLRNRLSPVLWYENKGRQIFSFNGSLSAESSSPQLLKLIQAINSGETCVVSEFLNGSVDLRCLRQIAGFGPFANG